MTRSAGLQRRVRICKRCGQRFIHTNRMERRNPARLQGPLLGGWDPVENHWFNTHTLACAKKVTA